MIGTTLGPYRIDSQAGRGGMGVVYRATDTRLQRPVAIKILPPEAVADPDRKARFVREAQAASALNHPNIVTIYQIGAEGSTDFIAMELVIGRSLDQVINRRPLPPDEALRYATAIAAALGAAHEIGIVHRDLKPANVMVTDKGQTKLLDFGLAKLVERAPDTVTPTVTGVHETRVGMVVGTVAYMSPEQARGDQVDVRSDIFSFGVVLHEMLTGVRPAPDASGDVLRAVPRDLRRIVGRCLQLDPSRRFQMVDDVRMALEDADLVSDTGSRAPAPVGRRRAALWVMPAVLAVAGAAAFVWWPRPAADAREPALTRLTMDSGLTTEEALSADGKFIAYASDRSGEGNLDIWVRQVAGGAPARLTIDPADDHDPSFSPDGSRIAFRSERDAGGIYVVSTLGGDARRIFDKGRRPRWSPDGTRIACWAGTDLAFLMDQADAPRIFVLPASGGEAQRVFSSFAVAWAPIWSADSKSLLFPGRREPDSPPDWWAAPLDGGAPRATGAYAKIHAGGLTAPESVFLPEAWTREGQVLFSATLGDSTNIWQIHVPDSGPSDGPPERLTSGTELETHPAVTPGGTLVFSAVTANPDLWSLPTDTLKGTVTGPMLRLMQDPASDVYPSFSPDGKTLVFVSNRSRSYDLWRRDMVSGKDDMMATDLAFPNLPIVAKDGSRVAFSPGPARARWSTLGLSAIARERSSTPQSICEDCGLVWDLSADGKWALLGTPRDDEIDALELSTGRTVPLMKAPGEIMGRLRISPDDRWVVFTHRFGGVMRVTVAPFRPGALVGREAWIPITEDDGVANMPAWSADSGLIYYLTDRDGNFCIWAQRIDRNNGHPSGDALAVWHFHEARRSMAAIPLPLRGLAVARDRLVTTLIESTGNIWMAAPSGR